MVGARDDALAIGRPMECAADEAMHPASAGVVPFLQFAHHLAARLTAHDDRDLYRLSKLGCDWVVGDPALCGVIPQVDLAVRHHP
jgi:hypothetical protein